MILREILREISKEKFPKRNQLGELANKDRLEMLLSARHRSDQDCHPELLSYIVTSD